MQSSFDWYLPNVVAQAYKKECYAKKESFELNLNVLVRLHEVQVNG